MERLDSADIGLVCEAIVDRYHGALRDTLPRIRDAIRSLSVDAASPELDTLRAAFDEVADQIDGHLAKEEHLLFPAFTALSVADRTGGRRPSLAFATVLHPIRLMETEHARIEAALDRLRELARSVNAVDEPSPAWRRCMADLARLDGELREHHRAENEVLFPRALELEQRLL